MPHMTQSSARPAMMILGVAFMMTFAVACKKGSGEVVDVEKPTSEAPKPPVVEAPPTRDARPDNPSASKGRSSKGSAAGQDSQDGEADGEDGEDSQDGQGAAAAAAAKGDGAKGDGAKGGGMTKAAEEFSAAFAKRDRDGIHVWVKDGSGVELTLGTVKDGKVQGKKTSIGDAKEFTQCLSAGPKYKDCSAQGLPMQFSVAGALKSCDDKGCCSFEVDRKDLKAKTLHLDQVCFASPKPKARPQLTSMRALLGG